MTDVVADAYATMADLRLFARDTAATDDAHDPDTSLKLLALEAAARAIDRTCDRTFRVAGEDATARYFTSYWSREWSRWAAVIPDLFDDTDMEVSFDSTGNGDWGDPVTTFRLLELDAPDQGQPWTRIVFDSTTGVCTGKHRIKGTAVWGWDAIPSTIREANLLQASRFLKRREAPFGVAGSPDMGNELRLLAKLDPDVALMLTAYRRYF